MHQHELATKFTRKYDYRRVRYEDPLVTKDKICLIENTKPKLNILDKDTYNIDELDDTIGMT